MTEWYKTEMVYDWMAQDWNSVWLNDARLKWCMTVGIMHDTQEKQREYNNNPHHLDN